MHGILVGEWTTKVVVDVKRKLDEGLRMALDGSEQLLWQLRCGDSERTSPIRSYNPPTKVINTDSSHEARPDQKKKLQRQPPSIKRSMLLQLRTIDEK